MFILNNYVVIVCPKVLAEDVRNSDVSLTSRKVTLFCKTNTPDVQQNATNHRILVLNLIYLTF